MCAASLLPSSLRGRCIKVTDYTSGTDFDPRFRLSGVEADERQHRERVASDSLAAGNAICD